MARARSKKAMKVGRSVARANQRALRVLARMRRSNESLSFAARAEHIDPRTVHKYVGSELKRSNSTGRRRPTKDDRRPRRMLIPTVLGTTPAVIRGSKQATRLGRYLSAVGKYLRTGSTDGITEFRGQSIGGHALITDPDALSSLAQAGALELAEIYAMPGASS